MPLKVSAKTTAGATTNPKFILLGEDDIDDEELLREVFTTVDKSLDLTFVNNGRLIISTLDGIETPRLPDLIILDYNMPALNGAEILRELKKNERYEHIPKIIWSTSNSNTYKELCLRLGARDYVIKPSSMQELTEIARYMLSFSQAQ